MSDFSKVINRLDIQKSRKAVLADNPNGQNYTKYFSRQKSRKIEKIPTILILPAFSYANGTFTQSPLLVFQYNVSLSGNWYIESFVEPEWENIAFTVKFRVGSTVYRYLLFGNETDQLANPQQYFTRYNNNKLGKNCCFEAWYTGQIQFTDYVGLGTDMSIRTSLQSNPSDAVVTQVTQNASVPKSRNDLGIALPEALPYNQDNVVFLDNVI